jgi:hypothetical protein
MTLSRLCVISATEARFDPQCLRPAIGVIPELRPLERKMPDQDTFIRQTQELWEMLTDTPLDLLEAMLIADRAARFYAILLQPLSKSPDSQAEE